MMISALEIGIALSLPIVVLAQMLVARSRPVRVRVRSAEQARRPRV